MLSVKAEEKDENSGEQPFLNASRSPSLQPTMKWEKEKQNVTMMRFVSHLTAIRRKYSEILTKGSFEWGKCSNKTGFITFTRRLGKQQLFCCFNLGYGSIRNRDAEKCQIAFESKFDGKRFALRQARVCDC